MADKRSKLATHSKDTEDNQALSQAMNRSIMSASARVARLATLGAIFAVVAITASGRATSPTQWSPFSGHPPLEGAAQIDLPRRGHWNQHTRQT